MFLMKMNIVRKVMAISFFIGCSGGCNISLAQQWNVQLNKKNTTCNGYTDGKAEIIISGSVNPHSVKWYSSTLILDSVSMNPDADNTIYELSGSVSNGAGEYMPVGKSGNGFLHRGLIRFPVSSFIPPLAQVVGASVKMNLSNTSGSSGIKVIEFHKLLQDWGEGNSDAGPQAGQGEPATANDATWLYRYYPGSLWNAAGGDYSPTISAQTTVNNPAFYTWNGSGLAADVQSWLNSSSPNNGWILVGLENGAKSGKRFDTRENSIPANRPVLKVIYQYPTLIGNLDSIDNLPPGMYTVVVSDNLNQDTTIQFEITTPAPLMSSIYSTNATCLQNNGSAHIEVTGGVLPYSFHWSNGQMNDSIHQLATGVYTVQVSDSFGCIIHDSVSVSNVGITDSVLNSDTACTSYSWNGVNITLPGFYPRYLINTSGCDSVIWLQLHLTGSFSDTVKIEPPSGQSSLCPLGSIILKAYPLNELFDYDWSNGSHADSLVVATPQSIQLTVTDQYGCSRSSVPYLVQNGYRNSDFNLDGLTNTQDFLVLLSVFGQSCQNCFADIDQSGFIDVADFLQLVSSFNLGCQF